MNLTRQARRLLAVCRLQGLRLGLAESCTGGLVASSITAIPGSSDVFLGGVVSYSNSVKQALLGVREETLAEHGAVSEQCVREMATGAARALQADCSIAISGIAGPGGGTKDKPVGTVFIAWLVRGQMNSMLVVLTGRRNSVRRKAAAIAMQCLADTLAKQIGATNHA
ncbi:MAG TPA: CinA family protein [Spirochaetales bacterium]|nr:CinA family protein [Spirochaetales bacterium]